MDAGDVRINIRRELDSPSPDALRAAADEMERRERAARKAAKRRRRAARRKARDRATVKRALLDVVEGSTDGRARVEAARALRDLDMV